MNKLWAAFSGKYLRENFNEHGHIRPFIVSVFIFGLAIGIYQNVLNNYLSDVLQFQPTARGWAEFFRELPGLLLVAIFAVLYRFTESKLIRIAFAISCLGMLGLVVAMERALWGIFFVVVFSAGEHILLPIRDTFAMHHAKRGKEAMAMGQTKRVHNLGLILGFACVSLVFYLFRHFNERRLLGPVVDRVSDATLDGTVDGVLASGAKGLSNFMGIGNLDFRLSFIIAALCLVAGFFLTLRFSDLHNRIKRERFYFRKKYWKYYVLEVFFGARKQVFLTFGPYVLILIYGLRAENLGLLFIVNSLLGIVLAPKLGQLIDYFGYKVILIADAFVLILLCLAYGFVPVFLPRVTGLWIVCALFVIDSLLFHVSSARNVYVRTLGDKDETMATVATGVSLNHVISVVIAILGGVLWESLGVQYLFSVAALFSLSSMLFCFSLPPRLPPIELLGGISGKAAQ